MNGMVTAAYYALWFFWLPLLVLAVYGVVPALAVFAAAVWQEKS